MAKEERAEVKTRNLKQTALTQTPKEINTLQYHANKSVCRKVSCQRVIQIFK